MGQNRKKLPCPKIRIFDYPAVIDFPQKMEVTVMAPNHGWDPVGSLLGPMGSDWVKKMGRKITMPKNLHFRLPRGHRFFVKNGKYVYGAKSGWGHCRDHLGDNGVPLGKKMDQNRKKLPCPQILIFDYPAIIDFSRKMEVTVMVPNHSWDPVGTLFGSMGSDLVQKMGQNRKKLPYPKIRNYPALIDFL